MLHLSRLFSAKPTSFPSARATSLHDDLCLGGLLPAEAATNSAAWSAYLSIQFGHALSPSVYGHCNMVLFYGRQYISSLISNNIVDSSIAATWTVDDRKYWCGFSNTSMRGLVVFIENDKLHRCDRQLLPQANSQLLWRLVDTYNTLIAINDPA